jgi:ABC-type ATPase with predicted acetyltransferase domain
VETGELKVRRRSEFFQIRRWRRTYDRVHGRFSFNISYETAVKVTARSLAVAEAFGLGVDESRRFSVLDVELKIGFGDIVYVTGDSGSGKSVLLRALKQDLGSDVADIADIQIEHDRPLVETLGSTVEEAIGLLSKAGLNDAFLFLRTYNQLSDGQKYRYRLARLIESKKQWWILDEFAATLDRDTAKIVAFNLQKLARQLGMTVVAATTHLDLFTDLGPNVHVHKRFGKEIAVNYYDNGLVRECSLNREMLIEEGTTKTWQQFSAFHYRSHRIAAPRKIFCLRRGEELCGVIVYCYPPPTSFGRRLVLPKMSMKQLNESLSVISRVVVHPKYRTVGLGTRLVRDTLPLTGTEYVEMSAVMAKYNPFAERAGMKRILEQPPPREAVRVLKTLDLLGFNDRLLCSTHYILSTLRKMSREEIARIKEAFVRNKHTRFLKSFSCRLPFGTREAYEQAIESASFERMASLIRICSFLAQRKVYLFWKKQIT